VIGCASSTSAGQFFLTRIVALGDRAHFGAIPLFHSWSRAASLAPAALFSADHDSNSVQISVLREERTGKLLFRLSKI
jgi:hypothetical protein